MIWALIINLSTKIILLLTLSLILPSRLQWFGWLITKPQLLLIFIFISLIGWIVTGLIRLVSPKSTYSQWFVIIDLFIVGITIAVLLIFAKSV